jgi:hypothetical protein
VGLLLVKIELLCMLINIYDAKLENYNNQNFPDKEMWLETKKLLDDMDKISGHDFSNKLAEKTIAKDATYVINDVLTISFEAPLSVTPEQASALYFFLYSKQNGGFQQIINDVNGPQQY